MLLDSFRINKNVLDLLEAYVTFQMENDFPPANKIIVVNETQPNSIVPQIKFINDGWSVTSPSFNFKKINLQQEYKAPSPMYKSKGYFSCTNAEKLENFYTGSITSNHNRYYQTIYSNKNTSSEHREFDISYAHISGSGSSYTNIIGNTTTEYLPAKTMFRKYMMDCFESTSGKFQFKNNANGDYFYVVHFDRDSIKDRLDPGNFQITLSPIVSNPNQLYNTGSNFYFDTGSDVIFTLIDDSSDGKEKISYTEDIKDYYYLVSGSLQDGIHDTDDANAWGVVFPKKGFLILDGVVLDQSCSFNTVTASIQGDNIQKLFYAISGSTSPNAVRSEYGAWYARSSELTLVETYFCRIKADEMSYSSNPTYVSGSKNEVRFFSFRENPKVAITTIGLYNDKRELIAIGKTKKPIIKGNKDEYVFQVRVRTN
jgi:hypothetical protein